MSTEAYDRFEYDLFDRCQSELRRQWLRNGNGSVWRIPRSAFERLMQEDNARHGIPESWLKLLSLANRTALQRNTEGEESNFTQSEFDDLYKWCSVLNKPVPAHLLGSSSRPGLTTEISEKPRSLLYLFEKQIVIKSAAGLLILAIGISAGWFASYNSNQKDNAQLVSQLEEANSNRQQSDKQSKQESAAAKALQTQLQSSNQEKNSLKSRLDAAVAALTKKASMPQMQDLDLQSTFHVKRNLESAGNGDIVLSPAFSIVGPTSPVFTWSKSPDVPFEIQVFDRDKDILVAKSLTLKSGTLSATLDKPLIRGRYYSWVLARTQPGEGLSLHPVQFFVMKESDAKIVAAKLMKLGMYSELLRYGGQIAKDAAKKIKVLSQKSQ